MSTRKTVLLDDEVRTAARDLANRYGCSTSEAIRRAVLRHRDALLGLPRSRRQERVRVLDRLFDLFEDHDAADEVRRLQGAGRGVLMTVHLDTDFLVYALASAGPNSPSMRQAA